MEQRFDCRPRGGQHKLLIQIPEKAALLPITFGAFEWLTNAPVLKPERVV